VLAIEADGLDHAARVPPHTRNRSPGCARSDLPIVLHGATMAGVAVVAAPCEGPLMKFASHLSIAVLLWALVACRPSDAPPGETSGVPAGDNSRNALDWEGVYVGTVPCADCAGIRTRIELDRDGGYSRSLVYL